MQKNLVEICYTSRVIANFVPYFVAMVTSKRGRKMGNENGKGKGKMKENKKKKRKGQVKVKEKG